MTDFQILLWIAKGLLSKKLQLEALLQYEKIDVALIKESHYTTQFCINTTHNYNVIHSFHPSDKRQGGASIFVRKKIA